MVHYIVYRGVYISLAAMREEYFPLFLHGANDPEVNRGVLLRHPVTFEAELEWYRSIKDRKNADLFAILLNEPNEQNRYIGHCDLNQITWPSGFAKTGSIICDKGAHRKGYGTEAKLLLLHHAFYTRGLRKVCSEVKAFNGNSFGHLIKCGYKVLGRKKCHHFDNGTFADEIMLEVFRSDFDPLWRKYQETKQLPQLTPEQRIMLRDEMER